MFTQKIRRGVLALIMMPVMIQAGMAQWAPPVGEEPFDDQAAAAHAGPDHGHGAELATAVPESGLDGAGGRCRQPNIGCDCADCTNYFIAHSLVIPEIGRTSSRLSPSGYLDNDRVVLFFNLQFAPPTPPPR